MASRRVLFRADAGVIMGIGHLMRCLTLGIELKRNGFRVEFACQSIPDTFESQLRDLDFDLVKLSPIREQPDELEHSKWLDTSQIQDASALVQARREVFYDWVVVDHYALDYRWEDGIRDIAGSIMVIDDLRDRKHHCDLFLNQNILEMSEKRIYDKLLTNECERLIGPQYALLRQEFAKMRSAASVREGGLRKLIVFLGGGDESNLTQTCIEIIGEELAEHKKKHPLVEVIVSGINPNIDSIKESCLKYGFQLTIDCEEMAKVMAKADLAVGAGGSSSWERCSVGLPTLVLTTAKNQDKIAQQICLQGAGVLLGGVDDGLHRRLRIELNRIIRDPVRLREMSKNAFGITDGAGASKVAEIMIKESEIRRPL